MRPVHGCRAAHGAGGSAHMHMLAGHPPSACVQRGCLMLPCARTSIHLANEGYPPSACRLGVPVQLIPGQDAQAPPRWAVRAAALMAQGGRPLAPPHRITAAHAAVQQQRLLLRLTLRVEQQAAASGTDQDQSSQIIHTGVAVAPAGPARVH